MGKDSGNTVERFTKTFVDRATHGVDAKGSVKQRLYWESALPGFGLRVGATAKAFFVQREVHGETRRYTVGRYGVLTVEEAREKARKALDKMRDGVNPKAEQRRAAVKGMTLQDAFDLYRGDAGRDPRTISDYEHSLKTYLADWLDRPLAELGTDEGRMEVNKKHKQIAHDVAKGKYARKDRKGKPRPHVLRTGETTANHAMHAFRTIWNRAMKQSSALPVSPTINVGWFEPLKTAVKPRASIAYDLLPKWYAGVQKCANPERRDFLMLTILTGLRSNDAKTLRWEHVHLDERRVHLPDPKGGTRRAFDLPLSDKLVELLQARKIAHDEQLAKKLLPKHAAPWVFGAWSTTGHIVEGREPIAGVSYNVHELRNTFATVARSKAEVADLKVSALLNHGGKTITDRYTGRPLDDLREPMQKITDTFYALFDPPPANADNVVSIKRAAKGGA